MSIETRYTETLKRQSGEDIAEVCERAVTEIRNNGWHQGESVGRDGGICLIESLSRASKYLDLRGCEDLFPAHNYRRLLDHMEWVIFGPYERRPNSGYRMADWNDRPGRQEQEVLDALHKGAKLALNPEAARED